MKSSEKKNGTAQEPAKNSAASSTPNAIGEVHIHENVVAALVRRAALSQPGVSRLAGNSFVDNIAEIVGSRRIQSRAILITMEENDSLSVEVRINVCFGCKVREVAVSVQKAVVAAVQDATGMTVSAVKVSVEEIEDPAELADEQEPSSSEEP